MLQKNNTFKVLEKFLDAPTKRFQLRALSREVRLSTTAVKSALTGLLKSELIIKKTENNIHYYISNRKNENFKDVKKNHIIKQLKDSGLIKFLDEKLNYPEAIILFGSASKGEDTENSDIDIFVLATTKKEIYTEGFEKKLNRQIKLLIMSENEFEVAKKKNPELINNIANGIIIKGYLKVI